MARRVAELAVLIAAAALGCSFQSESESGANALPNQLVDGTTKISIEAPPPELRGRVAIAAGGRLYTHPSYASPSYTLRLPDPPLHAAEAPSRTRAFRVVGIVRALDPALGGSIATPTEFIAVTNDLAGESEDPPRGCGARFFDLDHLRTLLYVPKVHLAPVTTRGLELQPFSAAGEDETMVVGAGVRVGAPVDRGLPPVPGGREAARWRWIDADGIRVAAPIPEDAIGLAWDPADAPELRARGEELMRDAEGGVLWLDDEGGATVTLAVYNECGAHTRVVDDPAEVASLRELALELFYDQRPPPDPAPVILPEADYLIPAGTALRWADGELAGEVLRDWGVSVGVGQSWNGRRCFPLVLSGELAPVDRPAFACVDPDQLQPLADAGGFAVAADLELGGSVELGPAEVLFGAYGEDLLRPVFNMHHASVAECLRPMLDADEAPAPTRWVLELIVTEAGNVDAVELTALGATHPAVEDCLRAEAFTWLMPTGGGQVRVPVTLGPWDPAMAESAEPESAEPESAESEPEPERGKVIILDDE